MQIIADLHLHSKYSRAVSQSMDLAGIASWSAKAGINLVTTGDWTHPIWFKSIKTELKETTPGIFTHSTNPNVKFLLTTEISSIYSQGDKSRRVHNLIFSPSISTSEKIINELRSRGANLLADGRPIIGLSSKNLLGLVLEIDKNCLLIPCHIWTPWFSLFGSKSGFDSIEDCFGQENAKNIYAIETGLSCYDEKTEALTNNGWKKFNDINYNDKMYTLNLTTQKIECQNPTKIHQYHYKGKMYRLKTKRADLFITPNHKLVYSHCDFRKKPVFTLKEAKSLFNKSKRLKKDGVWIGDKPEYFILPEVKIKHGSRHYSGYRTKKERYISIKPWLKFFGFWVAEGWTTQGKNSDYNVCICNNDKSLLKEMEKILEGFNYNVYWDKKTNNTLRVRDYQLFCYLKQFGKCYDKHIPQSIKVLSKKLLKIFLEYYIKGDGHIYGRNNKGLSATTTSIRLRDDLQEIALKIGFSAYYRPHKPKGTSFQSPNYNYKKRYKQRNDSWVVFFIRKNVHTILPSLIKRGNHIEKWVDFDGEVYCASVPNHTLYIRRGGIPLWCGNSDPIMNWQIQELESRSIVSFSDAHSGPKLGREATVFIENRKLNIKDKKFQISYFDIINAIKQNPQGRLKIGYTIEFFPEEGKYHWTGHRNCNLRYRPQEVKEKGIICPVCHQPLTVGVENRVLDLSSKIISPDNLLLIKNNVGLTFVYDREKKRRPFVSLIPLMEVLIETNDGSNTKAVKEFERLISSFASEFDILLRKTYDEIEKAGGEKLRQAVQIVRERKVFVDPGYDGVFGKVKIFNEGIDEKPDIEKQQSLF